MTQPSRIRIPLVAALAASLALGSGAAAAVGAPATSAPTISPSNTAPPSSAPPASTADGRAMAKQTNAHLRALQKIADQNQGNRAVGTTGYQASMAYAEKVLKSAGYTVTRNPSARTPP